MATGSRFRVLLWMATTLGIAFIGASMVAIVVTLGYRFKRDWVR